MVSNKLSYDKICEQWAEIRNKMPVNKCVIDFVKDLAKGAYILDIGCGTGMPIDKYLSDNGFNVFGIDISENMISHAKALSLRNSTFICGEFLQFEFKNQFDAIIAFDSLWHVKYSDQIKVLKKLTELLKSNGKLLFTAGKTDGEIIGKMFNEKFYYSSLDKDKYISMLSENGFVINECIIDYKEETTGDRDLLITAIKR